MNARAYRVTVANILPSAIAQDGQRAGLSGTVCSTGQGFGSWGIEPSTTVELAETVDGTVRPFVTTLLKAYGEECAYVTLDGAQPQLWHANGDVEPLVVATPHSVPLT